MKASREALVKSLAGCARITADSASPGEPRSPAGQAPTPCDVLVVDVSAPSGLVAITDFRAHGCDTPIIAFGVGSATSDIIACAAAGAAGYVLADASISELVEAIVNVASRRLVCPPKIAFDLFSLVGAAQAPQAPGLTPRETEVLRLVGQSLSNKEISARLGIAVSTVKNHVHSILEKAGASSRRHAALKSRLLNSPPLHSSGPSEDLVRQTLGI